MKSNFNLLAGVSAPATLDHAINAINNDLKSVSIDTTKRKEFIDANVLTYFCAISVWIHMFDDDVTFQHLLLDEINSKGLAYAINNARDVNDAIISEKPLPKGSIWSHRVATLVISRGEVSSRFKPRDFELSLSAIGDPDIILQLNQETKFLKRFSPVGASWLADVAINDFISRQKSMRKHDIETHSRPSYKYWSSYVADVIKENFPWKRIIRECERILSDETAYAFSSGITLDTDARLGNKILAYIGQNPDCVLPIFGRNYAGLNETSAVTGETKGIAVPKNSKTYRLIAAEEVSRQAKCLEIFHIIDPYLENVGIDLHDQCKNKALCKVASSQKDFATIDVTAASDGLTQMLFRDLFPAEFCDLVEPLLPMTIIFPKGRKVTLTSRCTMGNALTFALECIVFWAIDYCAIEYHRIFGVSTPRVTLADWEGTSYLLKLPGVYGDDQIAPSVCFDLITEIHELFGFTINTEKSFRGAQSYREACGVEFWNGREVTALYYPRTPIEGRLTASSVELVNNIKRDSRNDVYYDSLMSLISLQHQMIYAGYHKSSDVLTALICWCCPEMTTSSISDYHSSDLLGYFESVNSTQKESFYEFTSPYEVYSAKHKPFHLPSGIDVKFDYSFEWTNGSHYDDDGDNLTRSDTVSFTSTGTHESVPLASCQAALDWAKQTYPKFDLRESRIRNVGKKKMILKSKASEGTPMHLSPSVKYDVSDARVLSPIEIALIDQWKYTNFLRNGSSYEHSSDTLEGIIERACNITYNPYYKCSDPHSTAYHKLFGRPYIAWDLKALR